jgi:hypothetical protein
MHDLALLALITNRSHIVRICRLGGLCNHAGEVFALLRVHEEIATLAYHGVDSVQRYICEAQLELPPALALHLNKQSKAAQSSACVPGQAALRQHHVQKQRCGYRDAQGHRLQTSPLTP